ncbi:MAG: sulfate reduction electron transfer complex DsrMKJOP subunit DsrJ [Polyangiaceae bacterium]|nr:sulfate reduction electron transfer complex DsrMKJOP subunit DsrJ [Polyangiaceae bacterium]
MVDGGRVLGGLFVVLVVGAVPAWIGSVRSAAARPEVALPAGGGRCVVAAARMRSEHPALLADWRTRAVRSGVRSYHAEDGREFSIDLSETCFSCHDSAVSFCDRCHTEVGIAPSCWGCHAKATREKP